MTTAPSFDELKQAHTALQADHRRLQAQYRKAQLKIAKFEEERRLDRARRFGASSEVGDHQYRLFDEAETNLDVDAANTDSEEGGIEADETVEVAAHTKRRPKRKPLPQDLPRVVVQHDLPLAERVCGCGGEMAVIGEKITDLRPFDPKAFTEALFGDKDAVKSAA